MKYLTDRQEIAEAMNFGKYPVLCVNLETPKAGWDDCYEGDKVLVAPSEYSRKDECIRCVINKFGDEPERYSLMPNPVFLQDSFGYSDVKEMLGWAQAPVIHPSEVVIVIEDHPQHRTCRVHKMQVSKTVEKFVFPTCHLEEIE